MDQEKELYISEARELLSSIEENLLELEEEPLNLESMQGLMRNLHTLKGNSAMVGLDTISHATHILEDLLNEKIDQKSPLSPEIIQLLFKVSDLLQQCVHDYASDSLSSQSGESLMKLIDLVTPSDNNEEISDENEESSLSPIHNLTQRFFFLESLQKGRKPCLVCFKEQEFGFIYHYDPLTNYLHLLKESLDAKILLTTDHIPSWESYDVSETYCSLSFVLAGQEKEIHRLRADLPLEIASSQTIDWEDLLIIEEKANLRSDAPLLYSGVEQELIGSLANHLQSISHQRESICHLQEMLKYSKDLLALVSILIMDLEKERECGYFLTCNIHLFLHQLICIFQSQQITVETKEQLFHDSLNAMMELTASVNQEEKQEIDLQGIFNDLLELIHVSPKITEEKKEQDITSKPSITDKEKNPTSLPQKSSGSEVEQTLKIKRSKIDDLMKKAAEIVVAKNAIGHAIENLAHDDGQSLQIQLKKSYDRLDKLCIDMQNTVMDIRMLPVGVVFKKFKRYVRDLSRELHKKVELIIEGEDTAIDKDIVEKIGEPLIHLIRNALDHGIEEPSEREEKGKKEEGQLRIAAYQEAEKIHIEIEDDGRGIDPDQVLKKARKKGLITPKEEERLNHNEIINLIFHPGFSTTETVSNVSGRGVGMDVVMKAVNSLLGSIHVDSKFQKGTKINISLPLTLALTRVLVFEINKNYYGIPIDEVRTALKCSRVELQTIKGQQVICFREDLLPIIDFLEESKEMKQNQVNHEKEHILITESGYALPVTSVLGEREVVLKPFPKIINTLVFQGSAILEDGSILLIIDSHHLKNGGA